MQLDLDLTSKVGDEEENRHEAEHRAGRCDPGGGLQGHVAEQP